MNNNLGVFLGNRNEVAIFKWADLWNCELLMVAPGNVSTIPIEGQREPRFLSACPNGIYLAFWSFTGESFRLIDITGNHLWSAWMNSDKCVPIYIKFSASGDAAACFYHFDGVPGVFFCDIRQGFSTTFGCCGSPIGHDGDLRYFALSSLDRYEYNELPFYEADTVSGRISKLSLETAMEKIKNGPVILDRNRCIVAQPAILKGGWEGLAIQPDNTGYVIQRAGDVSWFAADSEKPEVTFKDCLRESERNRDYCKIMSLSGDNALIQIHEKSIVVNRHHGVTWRGDKQVSTRLKGNRVLAQYEDDTVEIINDDGSIEVKYQLPLQGFPMAADIVDDVLYVAQVGSKYEVLTFTLSKKSE